MCGRFQFTVLPNKVGKQIKQKTEDKNLVYATGEIFPTNNVLCIVPKESKIDLESMKWGIQTINLQINAREESLNNKISYKNIKNNRCAIIANGFYEWDKNKHKHYISTKDSYIYLAGIFNDDHELLIVTKEANGVFTNIHNRIPVIMNQKEMLNYLQNNKQEITNKELIIKDINEQTSLF